jgi:hypothetical protein
MTCATVPPSSFDCSGAGPQPFLSMTCTCRY